MSTVPRAKQGKPSSLPVSTPEASKHSRRVQSPTARGRKPTSSDSVASPTSSRSFSSHRQGSSDRVSPRRSTANSADLEPSLKGNRTSATTGGTTSRSNKSSRSTTPPNSTISTAANTSRRRSSNNRQSNSSSPGGKPRTQGTRRAPPSSTSPGPRPAPVRKAMSEPDATSSSRTRKSLSLSDAPTDSSPSSPKLKKVPSDREQRLLKFSSSFSCVDKGSISATTGGKRASTVTKGRRSNKGDERASSQPSSPEQAPLPLHPASEEVGKDGDSSSGDEEAPLRRMERVHSAVVPEDYFTRMSPAGASQKIVLKSNPLNNVRPPLPPQSTSELLLRSSLVRKVEPESPDDIYSPAMRLSNVTNPTALDLLTGNDSQDEESTPLAQEPDSATLVNNIVTAGAALEVALEVLAEVVNSTKRLHTTVNNKYQSKSKKMNWRKEGRQRADSNNDTPETASLRASYHMMDQSSPEGVPVNVAELHLRALSSTRESLNSALEVLQAVRAHEEGGGVGHEALRVTEELTFIKDTLKAIASMIIEMEGESNSTQSLALVEEMVGKIDKEVVQLKRSRSTKAPALSMMFDDKETLVSQVKASSQSLTAERARSHQRAIRKTQKRPTPPSIKIEELKLEGQLEKMRKVTIPLPPPPSQITITSCSTALEDPSVTVKTQTPATESDGQLVRWRRRYFRLTFTTLSYSHSYSQLKGKTFPLDASSSVQEKVGSRRNKPNTAFVLSHDSYQLTLRASNVEEKDKWLDMLHRIISIHKQKDESERAWYREQAEAWWWSGMIPNDGKDLTIEEWANVFASIIQRWPQGMGTAPQTAPRPSELKSVGSLPSMPKPSATSPMHEPQRHSSGTPTNGKTGVSNRPATMRASSAATSRAAVKQPGTLAIDPYSSLSFGNRGVSVPNIDEDDDDDDDDEDVVDKTPPKKPTIQRNISFTRRSPRSSDSASSSPMQSPLGTPQDRRFTAGGNPANFGTCEVEGLQVTRAKRLKGHQDRITCLSWGSDNKHLVSGSKESRVLVWEQDSSNGGILKPVEELKLHTGASWTLAAVFSPSMRFVAVAGLNQQITVGDWRHQAGRAFAYCSIGHGDEHMGAVTSLSYIGGEDHLLASGCVDSYVRVWDLASRKCIYRFSAQEDEVQCIESHKYDASIMVTGGADIVARVHDIRQPANCVAVLEGAESDVESVRFFDTYSTVAQYVASASRDGFCRIHDLRMGGKGPVMTSLVPENRGYTSVEFSPDGRWLYAACSVQNWHVIDAYTGHLVQQVSGHSDVTTCLRMNSFGQVCTGSWDQELQIWNVKRPKYW